MFRSDESLRLGTAENRDSGHASRTAAPTHALDISGVPAAHSDARPHAAPVSRAPSSDLRASFAHAVGAPAAARSSPRAPPPLARSPPRRDPLASRCRRARAGDVTFARSRSGPRDRPRALATRALARVPPPPPPRDGVVRRRRARDSRRSRSRPPRAPPPPRGRPGAVVLRPGRPRRRRPRANALRAGRPDRDPAAALSPRSSLPARARPLRDERQRRRHEHLHPGHVHPPPRASFGTRPSLFPPVGVADDPSVATPAEAQAPRTGGSGACSSSRAF